MQQISDAKYFKTLPLFLLYVFIPPVLVILISDLFSSYLGLRTSWGNSIFTVTVLLAAWEFGEIRKKSEANRWSYAQFAKTTRGKLTYILSLAVFLLFVSVPDWLAYFAGVGGFTFVALVVMSVFLGWLAVKLVIRVVGPKGMRLSA